MCRKEMKLKLPHSIQYHYDKEVTKNKVFFQKPASCLPGKKHSRHPVLILQGLQQGVRAQPLLLAQGGAVAIGAPERNKIFRN